MLLNNVDRYEEIPEVYGVFPLRDDFLEAGNAALKQYGLQAEVIDHVIHIPFTDRPLFSEDEYALYGVDDEDNADMKNWRMKIDACITLNGRPDEGIRDVWCDYSVIVPEDPEENYSDCYEPSNEEFNRAYDLIEIFLNKAVKAA